MDLKARIQEDMKAAMRAGERERLATIRMALAAIKQREIDERITLTEPQVLAVLEKLVKQRRESIVQFQAGGRADLVAKENAELAVLQQYLPAPLDEATLERLIDDAVTESGATSVKEMGRVMAILKSKTAVPTWLRWVRACGHACREGTRAASGTPPVAFPHASPLASRWARTAQLT